MIEGTRRQEREQPELPGSIGALLRDRGEGEGADETYLRLLDRTTEVVDTASYGELYRRSLAAALAMQRAGVKAGSPTVLLMETRLEFYYALFGAMLLGALPVAVYPPLDKKTLGRTIDHLRTVVAELDARAVVTSQLVFGVANQLRRRRTAILEVDGRRELDTPPSQLAGLADAGDRPVLLQYTSGSLGSPKAIELDTPAIFANLRAIGDAFDMRPTDAGLAWLPLYHDMGLHSIFFGLIYRMPVHVMSPLEFLRRPAAWLQGISRYRITHSPAPNFGYSYALRRIRDADLEGVDLSTWRVAMCGAEPIDEGVLGRFADRFSAWGFDRRAFMAAYGLAENTVAVSFAMPETGLRVATSDGEALRLEGVARPVLDVDSAAVEVVRVTSVGRPIAGHQLRIVEPSGGRSRELEDRHVGEIQCRGPSRMRGYRGLKDATSAVFDGDWLRTGDLGFVDDGELFITGRSKDLIIRAGKNYYPQDIETAATTGDVRRGSVIAFGVVDPVKGTEDVVVMAEVRSPALLEEGPDSFEAREKIREAVRDAVGLRLSDVALVARGVVPKTTSGKLRRPEARRMYQEGDMAPPEGPGLRLLLRIGIFNALPVSVQRTWERLARLVTRR